MTGGSQEGRGDGGAEWRVLRDFLVLAAVGIVAYVALAVANPRSLVESAVALLGPTSLEALLASLLVVAFAVAFLTWRRALEVIREVEASQVDRGRLENLAAIPRGQPSPIVVVDLEDGVTFLNQAAEEAFEDLPQQGLDHPVLAPVRELMERGGDIHRERDVETTIDHDGRFYEAKAWFDSGAGVARLYLHDVTAHRTLEEELRRSRRKLRQVTEHIQEAFWLADPERTEIVYVSPAYEDIWGRSQESLYDDPRTWFEAVHPEDRDRVREALDRQVDGGYDEEYRIVRPDGTVRWIRDQAFPVEDEDGEVVRVAGVAADVTEERLAFDQLTDALRREELLVDVLGHDVSNLLTRALPRLDLLEQRHPDLDDEVDQVREPLERAAEVLEKLTLLVRLGVDEVDAGDRQRLGSLVRDEVEGLRHAAGEADVEVVTTNELERDPLVDPLVGRAVENLVENAIEWSPAGETVGVHVCAGDDGGAEIRVVDRGPGVPEGERGRLFERFEQGRGDGADDAGGLGLGLPIARRIAERVGGSLGFRETPEGGSTFVLRLPSPDREAPETGARRPRRARAGDER